MQTAHSVTTVVRLKLSRASHICGCGGDLMTTSRRIYFRIVTRKGMDSPYRDSPGNHGTKVNYDGLSSCGNRGDVGIPQLPMKILSAFLESVRQDRRTDGHSVADSNTFATYVDLALGAPHEDWDKCAGRPFWTSRYIYIYIYIYICARITFRCIFRKWSEKMWSWLTWFKIESNTNFHRNSDEISGAITTGNL
jgi:hypothetical protein